MENVILVKSKNFAVRITDELIKLLVSIIKSSKQNHS